MTADVWFDGKAGASAETHDLDLGTWDPALAGTVITGRRLVQDSRELEPGEIFVALGRAGASALPWVQDALGRGAAAVLVDAEESPGELPDNAYAVTGLRSLIGDIAGDFLGHPDRALNLVGITGTNGKTSTSHLLVEAWQRLGVLSATIGTIGAGIAGEGRINMGMTTPQVTTLHQFLADFRARGVQQVAIEVSSHALEQQRVAGVEFGTIVFTNFTRDHLDYHGTMEEYAAQKAKIFTLPGVHTAIVNIDDAFGASHFETLADGIRRIGVSSRGTAGATVVGSNVQLTTGGVEFDLSIDGVTAHVASPLIGSFNVDNLLAAAAVLWVQDVPVDRIAALLGELPPVVGRMARIHPNPALPLVVVDAGHTPDAVQQAVTALRESGHSRLVTVFGATGDRDPGKRPEMARIVEGSSDLIVVTDDDVHFEDGDKIVADILAGFEHPERVIVLRDRAEAIAYAIDNAGPDDVVLLQGKGHEPYQIIGNERVPFSDLDTAERLIADRS